MLFFRTVGRIFLYVCIVSAMILAGATVPVVAQVPSNQTSSSSALPIDQQAQTLEVQQLTEQQLRDEKLRLERRRSEVETAIAEQESILAEAQSSITTLEDKIRELLSRQEQAPSETEVDPDDLVAENREVVTNEQLQTTIESANKGLSAAKEVELEAELELRTLQSNLQAIEESIERVDARLEEKTEEVREETNELRDTFLIGAAEYAAYIVSLVVLWIVVGVMQKRISAEPRFSPFVRRTINTVLIVVTILVTSVVLVYAFIGNLSLIITFFGFFSAALVVALQDFVSSFFAWLLIRAKNQFTESDVITVNTATGQITGQVVEIGLFRTGVKEKIGGDSPDNERFTGRLLYFPNNIILKNPVSNFNSDNRILWHQTDIRFRFGDDFPKIRDIINTVADDYFQMALQNRTRFLDNSKAVSKKYQPRVYTSLEEFGPKFTIWFPARVAHYREALQHITEGIMYQFYTHKIELGYPTRSLSKPESPTEFAEIANTGTADQNQ